MEDLDNSRRGVVLQCIDCKDSFIFDRGEQERFDLRHWPWPKRCPECRLTLGERKARERLEGE
ncbi:MAG: cytochrome C551 [Dehalococcoidales bacterium]|nr:cytochrome C551 [Dehalococcoidales bacterium]